jgi:hypothetical protein
MGGAPAFERTVIPSPKFITR